MLPIKAMMRRASGASESVAYPLDDYTDGLYGAWSIRKLLNAYSGPCIDMYDSGDASETDIGFVDGLLDWSTIGSLIGGGDVGSARTIYSQYGSNDFTNSHSAAVPDVWRSGAALNGFDFRNFGVKILRTPATSSAVPVIVFCLNFLSRGDSPDSYAEYLQLDDAGTSSRAQLYCETLASNRPHFAVTQGAGNAVDSIYTGGANFGSGVVTVIYDRSASGADKVKFRLNGTLQTRAGNWDAGTVSGNFSSGKRFFLGAGGPITSAVNKAIFKTPALAIWELSSAPDETWLDGVEASIGHTM